MGAAMPSIDGVEHRFLDAGGLRVHVAESGAGEPLVMLHGWPQNWYAYRHLIVALSPHFRVICPDMRGFGWTDAPPAGYEKRQLVKDLAALLNAMSLERVRLIGHDWGSIVGLMYTVTRPERIFRYLALGGAHLWPRVDLKATFAMRRFWYQLVISAPALGPALVSTPRFIRLLYRLWSEKQDSWSEAELVALTAQFAEPARARATSHLYRTWITRELPALAGGSFRHVQLTTPTLFLHGQQDSCIDPVLIRAGRRQVPNMTVELLPGVGHFLPEEAPSIVVKRALEFLA